MNTRALWDHAMDHLKSTEDHPEQTLERWRSETPARCTDRDLLAEYGWVVVSCGLTPHVATKQWPRFTAAFRNWAPVEVAGNRIAVRTEVLSFNRNARKLDAILDFADDLAREPGLMQRLAAMDLKLVMAKLSMLPFVGANNRYHLARNLGWDVVVKTGPVPRLAAYLETTSEALCERIAAETGERIRTVDLVLWNWGYQVGDTAMKEMASLFKLL